MARLLSVPSGWMARPAGAAVLAATVLVLLGLGTAVYTGTAGTRRAGQALLWASGTHNATAAALDAQQAAVDALIARVEELGAAQARERACLRLYDGVGQFA